MARLYTRKIFVGLHSPTVLVEKGRIHMRVLVLMLDATFTLINRRGRS